MVKTSAVACASPQALCRPSMRIPSSRVKEPSPYLAKPGNTFLLNRMVHNLGADQSYPDFPNKYRTKE